MVELLRLGVVRLKLVIRDGPGRRDSAVMANLPEILLAKSKERRAIELRVAADIIICVRVKLMASAIAPGLFRVVPRLYIHGAGVPVLLLALDVIAALQEQDALSRVRESVRERPPSSSRADDDYVVMIGL